MATSFTIIGLCMLFSEIVYMHKEKGNPESVKIYRVVLIMGAILVAASIVVRFVI
ncbi:MAG: hypothetical protein ACYDG2_03390 [Ruminiclostridium sp.]